MGTENACYEDRVFLAVEWLRMRYVERDNFLSDDDVLDAAVMFTTCVQAPDDHDDLWVDGDDTDFRRLIEDLYTACGVDNLEGPS